jgi:hypothetical protein
MGHHKGLLQESLRAQIIEAIERAGCGQLAGDVLEIGSYTGAMTRLLAEWAAPYDKIVHTIDPFDLSHEQSVTAGGMQLADYYLTQLGDKTQAEWFKENIEDCPNVLLFTGRSYDYMPPPGLRLCAAVVDGNHQPNHVRADLKLCWLLLDKGGLLIAHDYNHDLPGVTEAIDGFIQNNCGEQPDLSFLDQTIIIRKGGG